MRSKEDAHDYRYFPDPDLLPLEISADLLGEIAQSMPEVPAAKRSRFASAFGLSAYDADLLTASREAAQYFEEASRGLSGTLPKMVANWMTGALAATVLPSSTRSS